MEKAKQFQHFVFSEILPSIRKTGCYQLPKMIHNQFVILNETNLHEKVVSYLRRFHDDIIFNASLGEMQDTSEKRIKCYKMGYTSGMPDIFLLENNIEFSGLFIEFKSPNGKFIISEKQLQLSKELSYRNFKCLILDDYDEVIKEINDYLSTRRLKCYHCIKKFKNSETLKTHLQVIHRIN